MKKILKLSLILLFNIIQVSAQFKGEQCITKSEFIYQPQDVPFPSCHASTIIQSGKGLMAAWFGGTREKNPDVGIWISIYRKGSWTEPVEVANGIQHKDKRYPCWNPVLYNTGKEILLFYKVGPILRNGGENLRHPTTAAEHGRGHFVCLKILPVRSRTNLFCSATGT
jgi:predicted neuraminidase